MHPVEIELYRRLLWLSVIEASRGVARTADRPEGASERAWNRWEAGINPIPEQVSDNLLALVRRRQTILDDIQQRLNRGEQVILSIPKKSDDAVSFKLQQSITAQALAMGAKLEHEK